MAVEPRIHFGSELIHAFARVRSDCRHALPAFRARPFLTL